MSDVGTILFTPPPEGTIKLTETELLSPELIRQAWTLLYHPTSSNTRTTPGWPCGTNGGC